MVLSLLAIQSTMATRHMFVPHNYVSDILPRWKPAATMANAEKLAPVFRYMRAVTVCEDGLVYGIMAWDETHNAPGPLFLVAYDPSEPDESSNVVRVKMVCWPDDDENDIFKRACSLSVAKQWFEDVCYQNWVLHPRFTWDFDVLRS